MKKLIVWALIWVMMPVMAAPVTLEQVNKYAQQQYRNRWKESALSIRPVLAQNDEGGYTYTATVRFSKKSAEEVYAYLAAWAAETMDTVLSADPATGEIQAQQYLYSVASQVGGFYRFHLCLRPTVTLRAMKGEAQITVSLQYYEIVKTDKGVVNMLFQTASGAPLPAEQWLLADRYPYNERGKMPLATAEAFTKSYAYIQLLLEQLR